jgi:hypothetical protein
MTLQKALTEAFAAWAKELKVGRGASESREAKKAGKK